MDYITIAEAAALWEASERRVYKYLEEGRVLDAVRFGTAWMIPNEAVKPGDPRRERKRPQAESLKDDLYRIIEATTRPMPQDDPAKILDSVKEERLRLHYEGELAYLRGDFDLVKRCFNKTEGDDASRLRACSVAIAAAISTGDYQLFHELEGFLKGFMITGQNDELTFFAELSLANAYTGAAAPDMVPEWLKVGDITRLHPRLMPDAAYKRAKYFQYLGKFESALDVAQTALAFCGSAKGITFHDIYFRVVCAIACCALGRAEEERRWLTEAIDLALPHGCITPFAESFTAFGGLLEPLLKNEYPEYHEAVTGQWNTTFINWLGFHNQFTKDKITLILPLRDYQIALLAARGVPYSKIAERFHITVGRLRNIMNEIYGKLYVNNRNDLAKIIL